MLPEEDVTVHQLVIEGALKTKGGASKGEIPGIAQKEDPSNSIKLFYCGKKN